MTAIGKDAGKPQFTPAPWTFERMESAEEFAALKGETLAEHEGYYRDNNGDWIITKRDPDDDFGGRIATATFKGKAKRGETYKAPDPIGQANARLIAAAPELYEALDELVRWRAFMHPDAAPSVTRALSILAKARGESAR